MVTFVENLALGKDAWQSTTYPHDSYFRATRAVDGDRNPNNLACTRTEDEDWPTWRVDLGTIYRVDYVNITTRDGMFNLLALGRCGHNNFLKLKSNKGIFPWIALRWMPQDLSDD